MGPEQNDAARRATVTYPPEAPLPRFAFTGRSTIFQVINTSTLAAARKLAAEGFSPVALNFASARHPGGGFLNGARAQEVCNLRISDINFSNEQIHIARLKGSLDSTQLMLKVKGNALFDEKAVLKAWLAARQPDADEFVFNSQKSTQMNRTTIFKLFRAIAKNAGLAEGLQHPHTLKHTAAMLMVQQGANAYLIRQHLGHRSFDSTLAYVNPSDAEASAAAAQAFNRALS